MASGGNQTVLVFGTVASCQFLKINPNMICQNRFDLVFNIRIEPTFPL